METLDVYGAITELQKHKAFNGIGIVGYSFGGGVGLRTAMAHPAVQVAVAISAPSLGKLNSLFASTDKSFLLLAGDRDDYCPVDSLKEAEKANPEAVEVEIIENADHFFANPGHLEELYRQT